MYSMDSKLNEIVEPQLKNGHFTDAIKLAFLQLTHVLRDLSGSTDDGDKLVGDALGGPNPPIKLNDFQSRTDQAYQNGIQSILRGLYLAYRNPRNHYLLEDDEETAYRIILMIDSMIKVLPEAKSFNVENFIDEKVFDRYFVLDDKDWVLELLKLVPSQQRFAVFRQIVDRVKEGDKENIKVFVNALYSLMNPTELESVITYINERLASASEDDYPDLFIFICGEMWINIDRLTKLRIEKVIIQSLKRGYRDMHSKSGEISDGMLGTFAFPMGKNFQNKDELFNSVITLLWGSWYTQNYLSDYIITFPEIFEDDEQVSKLVKALIYATLSNKADLLRYAMLGNLKDFPETWKNKFKEKIEAGYSRSDPYVKGLLEKLE